MDVIDGAWIKARLEGKPRGTKSALARAMGVKPELVSKIIAGVRQVRVHWIPAILAFFEEDASELEAVDEARALVAVYDVEASAGPGLIPPDHEVLADRLEFPAGYLAHLTRTHPRHLRIVTVKGNSMLPTLKSGDLVMLDATKTSLGYDGLFVLRIDEALHVKRIGRSERAGHVTVISDNASVQPPVQRARAEIEVLGKVIWMGVKE